MKRIYIAGFFAMALFPLRTPADPVKTGAPAPVISALDQDGKMVNFADFYAKGLTLVYFYPKADTPGCTTESCSLRDAFPQFQAKNLTIVGVSEDSPKAQKNFKEKYQLPFELIADNDGKVAAAFGVPITLGLASRQSFLVKNGIVIWSSLRVKPKEHTQEVQNALDKLEKSGTN